MTRKTSAKSYGPKSDSLPLVVDSLFKKYGSSADYAVSDVSFFARWGEIVGLLGPNGAGKSTVLKSVTGMIPFEEGEILVGGYSVKKEPVSTKHNFGFVTDNHSVFVKMTGRQYLNFMADVFGVPSSERADRVAALEEVFRLGDAVENLISSYSHGMRQKICMMGSLIHTPPLWILDEPMIGLDPLTQEAVEGFMRGYVREGRTIIFSTHNLDAAERLCDRIVIINRGRITANLEKADYESGGHDVLVKYFTQEENPDA